MVHSVPWVVLCDDTMGVKRHIPSHTSSPDVHRDSFSFHKSHPYQKEKQVHSTTGFSAYSLGILDILDILDILFPGDLSERFYAENCLKKPQLALVNNYHASVPQVPTSVPTSGSPFVMYSGRQSSMWVRAIFQRIACMCSTKEKALEPLLRIATEG